MTGISAEQEKPRAKAIFVFALTLLVIVMAGLLFGYDQGVISGALRGINQQFSLSALLTEAVTSWVTLGALFGSLVGGELADRIGRKRAVIAAAILFTTGAAIQALAPDPLILVLGRFTVGAGVGVAAVAAPLYGAEMAPTDWRGRFVSAYQLAITIGIFLAYLVDAALSAEDSWRIMLGASAVPGLLLLIVALGAPESPRWLIKQGRREDARRVMAQMRPNDLDVRVAAIEKSLGEEDRKASWREVFRPRWRKPLIIAIGLAVFQQITGVNAIIYYADTIFASAGFATPAAQTAATTWAIGAVNIAATFIAVAFIDRLGRRPLLLAGLVGMGLSLVVTGLAFQFVGGARPSGGPNAAGIVTLLALVVFIASFAFSLGPVVWTVINEIFPGRIRGRAVAVATAVNWGSAFLVSEFFLTLVNLIGASASFWLFAFCCLGGLLWVLRRVPETKGRSLEQIERLWQDEVPRPV